MLFGLFARPVPPPLRFLLGNVTAHPVRLHPLHHRAAVIALVGHRLLDPGHVHLRWGRNSASRPTCSATAIPASLNVASSVVVSPLSAPCSVTASTAPVSRSTACSALCARCVRPSFIFAIRASSSAGLLHSLFDVRFLRLRSNRARSSRVGVVMPEAFASPRRNSS